MWSSVNWPTFFGAYRDGLNLLRRAFFFCDNLMKPLSMTRGTYRGFLYALIIVASTLYVYRVSIFDVNVSLFRIVYVFWVLIFLVSLLLGKLTFRRRYLFYISLFSGILIINICDLSRMSEMTVYGRDTVNHLINLSLVGLLLFYLNSEDKVNQFIRLFVLISLFALSIAVYGAIEGHIPFEEWLLAGKSDYVSQTALTLSYEGANRLAGSFYDPNFFGLYLCFVVILCFYIIQFLGGGKFYWVILLVTVLTLLLTISRSALAGLLVVLLVTLAKARRSSRVFMTVAVIGLLLGLIWLLASGGSPYIMQIFDQALSPESVDDRFRYISNGVDAFGRGLFLGVGTEGLLGKDIAVPSAHVVYLSLLAKHGIIGFAVYAIFIFYPLIYLSLAGPRLAPGYRYLILATYGALTTMYFAYDYFAFLEFQYLVFGIIYSIILNRLGLAKIALRAGQATSPGVARV